jgi:hypothetical protein
MPDCDHVWKYNGGNPVCRKCGVHQDGPGRLTLPAHRDENGVVHVHWPEGADNVPPT